MDRISRFILKHRKGVVLWVALLTLVSCVLFFCTRVNYRMSDYLPEDAQSTKALRIMEEEFSGALPNLRVMVKDVSVAQALEYKKQLAALPGVSSVMWLDDAADVTAPLETLDQATVATYYKDNAALFSVAVQTDREVEATDAIDKLIGESNALAGDAMNTATMQKMAVSETINAICILLPVIILILILATTSWLEPLLYLLTIGVAVLINMGTNAFFPQVSFITQSVSPILQLAVSLDYSIFLMHSFDKFRRETNDPQTAMKMAMKRALTSISASAATTLLGFAALLFMRFQIGSDLGLNLVKGIVLSFLSVMIFLPALTLVSLKLLDKTRHRSFLPSLKGVGSKLMKVRIPCLILVALLFVPSVLASSHNTYIYGNGKAAPTGRGGKSAIQISELFGESNAVVLLVPKGDVVREKLMCDELSGLPGVTAVVSYASMAGAQIPSEFVSDEIISQFYSASYARIILYTNTESEGTEAFAAVTAIENCAKSYYDTVYSLGESANLMDMKQVVESDTPTVNLIAIIGILIVLLLSFKSLSLPVLLLFTIESAVYINLAVPYFQGSSLCYIGYLVISTVQLGATVDYAILLTDNDRLNRRSMDKRMAMSASLDEHLISILISGAILSCAGFCLMLTSSNPIVSELGLLLGRGTLLSMAMVAFVLPALLSLFDKLISKTTYHSEFLKKVPSKEENDV